MAAFVRGSYQNSFADRNKRDRKHLFDAMSGNVIGDASFAKLFNLADFVILGTTDQNDAVTASPIFLSDTKDTNASLSALCQFPANTIRKIQIQVVATNGEHRYQFLTESRVLGGTVPQVLETAFLTECTATFEATSNTLALSAVPTGCVAPQWSDFGTPTGLSSGTIASGAASIGWMGGVSGAAGHITPFAANHQPTAVGMQHFHAVTHRTVDLGVGSTVLSGLVVQGATGAALGVGRVSAQARILPPIEASLYVAAGLVNIGVKGLVNDTVNWTVGVFIGDAAGAALA